VAVIITTATPWGGVMTSSPLVHRLLTLSLSLSLYGIYI
jgi:hypothetical protein